MLRNNDIQTRTLRNRRNLNQICIFLYLKILIVTAGQIIFWEVKFH